jgi:ribosomal protein S12 methylthiotransferase accessory factor
MAGHSRIDKRLLSIPKINHYASFLSATQGDGIGYKHYRRGTHRTIAPSDTMEKLRKLMPRMGITRCANVTGLDRIGIPVIMVCRPNSRSIAVSQGKGLTVDGAKASGLMESAETYHAERIDHPLRLSSFTDLEKHHQVISIRDLPSMVGTRYHPNLPILWIESRQLGSGDNFWLPYEIAHTNYTLPLPGGSGCFASSSNGLAGGNHILEAITHAICEVVERDSSSIWHQLHKSIRGCSRIDLDTVTDRSCREVLAGLDQAGIEVAAWDTTTDVGIASSYCTITDKVVQNAHPGVGAGCHPSREIALLRSLLEAVQVRTTYIAGSRDDLSRDEFTKFAISEKLRQIQAYLDCGAPQRNFNDIPTRESETFEEDLDWIRSRLEAAGIDDVFVVDLTKSEFNLPVARVVIPGLEGPHDDDRYVAGPRALAAAGKTL